MAERIIGVSDCWVCHGRGVVPAMSSPTVWEPLCPHCHGNGIVPVYSVSPPSLDRDDVTAGETDTAGEIPGEPR